MKLTFLTITILTICLFSCEKQNETVHPIMPLFGSCSVEYNPDSSSLREHLVGKWKWNMQECFWGSGSTSADKIVYAVFNADSTFSLTENFQVVEQGVWKIKRSNWDSTRFELDSAASTLYTYGDILVCNGLLKFYSSYYDGCDNLFVKVE